MVLNSNSVAALVLLPLILALTFECLLSSPMPALNRDQPQQFDPRANVAQQYQRPQPQQRTGQPSPGTGPVPQQAARPLRQNNFVLSAASDRLDYIPPRPQRNAVPMETRPQAPIPVEPRPEVVPTNSFSSVRGRDSDRPRKLRLVDQQESESETNEHVSPSSARSSHNPFAYNDNKSNSDQEEALRQQTELRKQQDQLSAAQRFLGELGGKGISSISSNGINVNNHQTTIKMGNNKNVNVNSFTSTLAPDNRRTEGDRMFVSAGNEKDGSERDDKGQESVKKRKKATSEQKEMKRKLMELAEKATSAPATALKYNEETHTYEPVDPNAELYKRKLQEAIKAISSRKLNAERLKKALENGDEEQEFKAGKSEVHLDQSNPVEAFGIEHEDGQKMDHYDQTHGDVLPSGEVEYGQEANHYAEKETEEEEELYRQQQQANSMYNDEFDQPNEDFYQETGPDQADEWPHEHQYAQETKRPLGDETRSEPELLDSYASRHLSRNGRGMSVPDIVADYVYDNARRGEFDETASSSGNNDDELEVSSKFGEVPEGPLREVRELLDDRLNRLSDMLYFRPEVLNQLLQIDDRQLAPIESEFKRMVLCNSDERFCNRDLTSCPAKRNEFPAGQPNGEFEDQADAYRTEVAPEDGAGFEESGSFEQFDETVRPSAYGAPEYASFREERLGEPQQRSFASKPRSSVGPSQARRFGAPPVYQPADSNYKSSRTKTYYAFEQAHETGPAPGAPPKEFKTSHRVEMSNGVPIVQSSGTATAFQRRNENQNHNQAQQPQLLPGNRNVAPPQNEVRSAVYNQPRRPEQNALNQAPNSNKVPATNQVRYQPAAPRLAVNPRPVAQPVYKPSGPRNEPQQQLPPPSSQQQDPQQRQPRPERPVPLGGPQFWQQPQSAPRQTPTANNWQKPAEVQRLHSTAGHSEPARSQPVQPVAGPKPAPPQVPSNRVQPFDLFQRSRATVSSSAVSKSN